MSTDLEPHSPAAPAWVELLPAAAEFARTIADTAFAPDAYRNKPAEIAGCVMMGDELGIGPMTALTKIDIVKGRPAPRAELARALVLRAGHDLWVEEATATRVTACGRRRNSDQVHRVTWTMDDAKRAGLAGSQTWRQYPRQMLTARATAELVRQMAPDVLAGIGIFAEEIEDGAELDVTDTPTVEATATAEPAKQTRKRNAKPAAKKPAKNPRPAKPAAIPPPLDDLDLDGPPPTVAAIAPAAPPDLDDIPHPADQGDDQDAQNTANDEPTTAQMRAIHAGLNDNDISDRTDRLAFVSAAVGHTVESSKNITRTEAGTVLDAIEQLRNGKLAVTVHAEDRWEITTIEEEPW
jgi:hypothetical protein